MSENVGRRWRGVRHWIFWAIPLLSFAWMYSADAQTLDWVSLGSPDGGSVTALVSCGESLFAGGNGWGISKYGGQSWEVPDASTQYVTSFYADRDGQLYAGTLGDGVLVRAGQTWEEHGLDGLDVFDITSTKEGYLFASTSNGIYRKYHNSEWNVLSNLIGSFSGMTTSNDETIVVSASPGIYTSSDNGMTWIRSHTSTPPGTYRFSVNSNGHILAGFSDAIGAFRGGILKSTDQGQSWSWVNSPLHGGDVYMIAHDSAGTLIISGEDVDGPDMDKVYRSTNGGETWEEIPTPRAKVTSFVTHFGRHYVGTLQGGVFRDDGMYQAWSAENEGLRGVEMGSLAKTGSDLLAAGPFGTYIFSADSTKWSRSEAGLPPGAHMLQLLSVESEDVIGTGIGGIFLYQKGTDNWSNMLPSNIVRTLYRVDDDTLIAGVQSHVFASTNNGHEWVGPISTAPGEIWALSADSIGLFASVVLDSSVPGVYRSDNTSSWRRIGIDSLLATELLRVGDKLFVLADGRLFTSRSSEDSWSEVDIPGEDEVLSIAVTESGRVLLAGTAHGAFYTNSESFLWKYAGLPARRITAIAVDSSDIFAAVHGLGLFRTEAIGLATKSERANPKTSEFHLFPSPASNRVRAKIDGSRSLRATVSIFDVVGRMVQRSEVTSEYRGVYVIELSSLVPGLYIMRISTASDVYAAPLIVIN